MKLYEAFAIAVERTACPMTTNSLLDPGRCFKFGRIRESRAVTLKDCMTACAAIAMLFFAMATATLARDDGRFANSPLKEWFDNLMSDRGLCCAYADGKRLSEDDWDTVDNHYRVRLSGHWQMVPDAAVIKGPNLYRRPMVWTSNDGDGGFYIRCFLPGTGT